jgi:hypothetical protein
MQEYVDLKSSSLDFFEGCGETIHIIDSRGRAHQFCSVSSAGIHYCANNEGKKGMQVLRPDQVRFYKFKMVKKQSPRANKYQGVCLLGYEFAEKLEQIKTILKPYVVRSFKVPCGSIDVRILWSDSTCPTYSTIHWFYDLEYMNSVKDTIVAELKSIGVEAEISLN